MRNLLFLTLMFSLMLCPFNSSAQENTYGYVAIGGGGYVCSVVESVVENLNGGNVFYAKTDVGGIYRWNEGTRDWTPLFAWVSPSQTSYLGTEAFVIDPSSPNKLYAMGGTSYWNGGATALLRSYDYGENWEAFDVSAKFKANGNGSDRQKGETLAVDPANGNVLYFGTRYNNGLFKSTDAGQTWNKVLSFPDSIGTKASFSFVEFDYNSAGPNGCSTIYVGSFKSGNNVFVSKDFGATWQSIGGYSLGKPQRCAYSINDGMLYVTYTAASTTVGAGKVMKYDTFNNIWTDITPASGRNYSGISLSVSSPNKLVCSTYNYWGNRQPWGWADAIYYSEDGGKSWKEKASNSYMDSNGIPWLRAAMHWVGSVSMSQNKPGWVFVCSGNGVFVTEDITANVPTWKFMAKGLEETVPVGQGMISIPGGPLISSVGDQGGFVHKDIHVPPTAQISQSVGFAYATLKPSTILRTVNSKVKSYGLDKNISNIYMSENNGDSWVKIPSTPDSLPNAMPAISADASIIVSKSHSTELGTRCYWSTDKGKTWNTATLGFNATPIGDAVNPQKFYAFNTVNGYLYKSTDGAKSFQAVSYIGTSGSSVLKSAPGFEGHIWVNNNGKVKYSTDEGKSFTSTSNFSCSAFALGKNAPDKDYPTLFIWGRAQIASPEGMYRSVDKGLTWIRANDDKHQWGHLANAGNIEADKNVYGRVYKSTAGMGIPWMGINTGTGVTTQLEANAEFGPNPFTGSITLRSKSANIKSVEVYNLQGVMVMRINTDLYPNETIGFGDELEKGVYLVNVYDTKGRYTTKIIKH